MSTSGHVWCACMPRSTSDGVSRRQHPAYASDLPRVSAFWFTQNATPGAEQTRGGAGRGEVLLWRMAGLRRGVGRGGLACVQKGHVGEEPPHPHPDPRVYGQRSAACCGCSCGCGRHARSSQVGNADAHRLMCCMCELRTHRGCQAHDVAMTGGSGRWDDRSLSATDQSRDSKVT